MGPIYVRGYMTRVWAAVSCYVPCCCSTACTPLAHDEVPLRQRVKCITGVACSSMGRGGARSSSALPGCVAHAYNFETCAADKDGYAIYFSRGVIPSNKEGEIR